MSDTPIPPIERHPPYSMDFVAHLYEGCYSDGITQEVLAEVGRNNEGRRMLDALTIVGLELRIAYD